MGTHRIPTEDEMFKLIRYGSGIIAGFDLSNDKRDIQQECWFVYRACERCYDPDKPASFASYFLKSVYRGRARIHSKVKYGRNAYDANAYHKKNQIDPCGSLCDPDKVEDDRDHGLLESRIAANNVLRQMRTNNSLPIDGYSRVFDYFATTMNHGMVAKRHGLKSKAGSSISIKTTMKAVRECIELGTIEV